jgi:tripartite-type tricarboxylate transporter receptor subunit TctC
MSKLSGISVTATIFLSALLGAAVAQPNRPLTIVVSTSAGSGPDTVARIVSVELQKKLGQTVVVENRVGASGTIGAAYVARAAADGLTILSTVDPPFTPSVALLKDVPFDAVTSFVPIAEVAITLPVLSVNANLPVRTAAEFVEYAKARPGKLNYGSPGIGTTQHLSMELFKLITKIDVMHVPFRETAGVMTALVGGHIDAVFVPYQLAKPLPPDKVRLLGVASKTRLDATLPTLSEQGFASFEADNRYGFLAPAHTPHDLVMRYNSAIREIMQMPDVVDQFHRQGMIISVGTPEEYADKIKKDLQKWHQVIKDSGIALP